MAKSKDPLELVQMLADVAELKKSQQVAASMVNLSAEAERLTLLEQYLGEYLEQSNKQKGELDIALMKSRHEFIDALTKAIGNQDQRRYH